MGVPRASTGEAAYRFQPELLVLAKYPNVAVKATGQAGYAEDRYPFRSLHPHLRQVFDAFGPQRMFWGTDITRMPCSWRQCVTLFTEELPWLTGHDLELVMGRAFLRLDRLEAAGKVKVHESNVADRPWRAGDVALRRRTGPESGARRDRRGRPAASVNAADYKVRLGGRGHNLRFPHILGRDFSGVVAATGEGVADLAVGDAVFGVLDAGIEGAYAEKLAIKAAIVARKPDRLSHQQAAAIALTGITAIWAVEDRATSGR